MSRWLFLPLDDRPITCLFPQVLAPLAGLDLVVPPRARLGRHLNPGDAAWLAQWLVARAQGAAGAIVCLDMLCYGGLVASRSPAVTEGEALARLETLRALRARGLQILAASVIMRLGMTVTSPETAGWHRLLVEWSQAVATPGREAEAAAIARQIPTSVLVAYRQARARNHRINREAVTLVAEGIIDRLVLLQEDCTPQGIHQQEQEALQEWAVALGVQDRVHLLPGADEGALVLLARAALAARGAPPPPFAVVYSHEATAGLPAPFEDRPLRETVALQVQAAGGTVGARGADGILLLVNTPVRRYGDLAVPDPVEGGWGQVTDGSPHLVELARAALAQGRPVAVADVAFANGADPLFTAALVEQVPWWRLAGYAAWNTAANTLGTAVAMAVLRSVGCTTPDRWAEPLLLRFLDDYVYQSQVRPAINRWLADRGMHPWHLGQAHGAVSRQVGRRMARASAPLLAALPEPRPRGVRVRLPWPRTFEVEIRLLRTGGEGGAQALRTGAARDTV